MTGVMQRLVQPDPAGGESQGVKWLKNRYTGFFLRKQMSLLFLMTKTITAFFVYVKNDCRTIYLGKKPTYNSTLQRYPPLTLYYVAF